MSIFEYIAAGMIFAAFLMVNLVMGTYLGRLTADAKKNAEADRQDKLKREMWAAIRHAFARELDTSDQQIGTDCAQQEPRYIRGAR